MLTHTSHVFENEPVSDVHLLVERAIPVDAVVGITASSPQRAPEGLPASFLPVPRTVADHGDGQKGHIDDEAHHKAAVDAIVDIDANRRFKAKRSGIVSPRDDLDGQVERAAGEERARLGEDSQTSVFLSSSGKALSNGGPDPRSDFLKGVIRVAAADVEDGRIQAELSGVGKDFGCLLDATHICCSFSGHAGS